MSTHNIGFYEEISKIITYDQISNTNLISSADPSPRLHSKEQEEQIKCVFDDN